MARMRWRAFWVSFSRTFGMTLILLTLATIIRGSVVPPGDQLERARAFTRRFEFDYLTWTLEALGQKLGWGALDAGGYLPVEERSQTVLDYLKLVDELWRVEAAINEIYADPAVSDPLAASTELRQQLDELLTRRAWLQPLAESILQAQVSVIVAEYGLSLGGQSIPPVLYHVTPPPSALIISPRDAIRVDQDISVSPDLTTEQIVALEGQVDAALNVSSLVVGIGGIGLYPTMVMETTDINWLAEVVAHEWVHNYLTLRPLGINYLASPELRIMNEMAASLAGKELGRAVVERFYPAYLPAKPNPFWKTIGPQPPQAEGFNFRREMHITRVHTDELLAQGRIEDAEAYMEERRRFLWEHGYHIRKLNQAYFAFYGAYADDSGQPGGAAGEDPVAAAVRALYDQSQDLADFIHQISWMASYETLLRRVQADR
jgi:hypothetical protein